MATDELLRVSARSGAACQPTHHPRPNVYSVIQMWLRLTPRSPTTLQELCNDALRAVSVELHNAGYTVDEPVKQTTESGWTHTAAIHPGPAKLSVAAQSGRDLNIRLRGISFGHTGRYFDLYDVYLWVRLEAVREQLAALHKLDSFQLDDPGPATGERTLGA